MTNNVSFRTALLELLGDGITEHEIMTIVRYFAAEKGRRAICDRETIRSIVQMEIQRDLWNNMDRLKEHIYHLDPENTSGILSNRLLRTVIKANRLPIKDVLAESLLSV